MAYEHLFNSAPVSKEIEYGGKIETVYFKRLTAGERMELRRGQKGEVKGGESTMELDLGNIEGANHKLVYFCNCDANGKRIFKTLSEVASLPGDFFDVLFVACNEALSESSAPR